MFFTSVTRQSKRLLVAAAIMVGIFLVLTGRPAAAEDIGKLFYGTRAGQSMTIVSKEGIGTANAVIRLKHTAQDAKSFCVEYMLDHSMRCVRQVLAEKKLADRVTGDCVKRTRTDMYGDNYSFHGSAKQQPELIKQGYFSESDYLIHRNGEERFFPFDTEIFQALCPGIAK
ncbi:hypothetical protein GGE07_000278 [Sinorhizobium terangae]|uniref:Uncharacterized protein n=1 Tax=Sinorhizobium terangae TaxID=110322 RepID=A0A6N7LNH7_SINTE|nr:hypothetical protein [Sinorhizobium terangae]MBB4183665.1 hypothetical protein [Sinorhizobium terangae]MQX18798.1 hypothetical protein [Sinorhizobium terangae]